MTFFFSFANIMKNKEQNFIKMPHTGNNYMVIGTHKHLNVNKYTIITEVKNYLKRKCNIQSLINCDIGTFFFF